MYIYIYVYIYIHIYIRGIVPIAGRPQVKDDNLLRFLILQREHYGEHICFGGVITLFHRNPNKFPNCCRYLTTILKVVWLTPGHFYRCHEPEWYGMVKFQPSRISKTINRPSRSHRHFYRCQNPLPNEQCSNPLLVDD